MTLHTPTSRRLASFSPGEGRPTPRASARSGARGIRPDGRRRFPLGPSVRKTTEGFQAPGSVVRFRAGEAEGTAA
ncbi:hypothetical protein [Streptomyces shenzhenensis]|uniref:hypothetical protein n=1 Tax=Streptomyces shenzhenensis TaxID=943815 RepID=UPI0015F01547|nr:hypothetical protein [Streptomyces shenzhenensis]